MLFARQSLKLSSKLTSFKASNTVSCFSIQQQEFQRSVKITTCQSATDLVGQGQLRHQRYYHYQQLEPTRQAMQEPLKVKLNLPSAKAPLRGSERAAGYDLFSAEECVVAANGKACIDTGISIAVPSGHYGRVAPRSGLAVKHFIDTGAGVVDEDYRGPLKVVLFNHSSTEFKVNIGDRIAQLILERISTPAVSVVDDLDSTERGSGGFGSTGVAGKPE